MSQPSKDVSACEWRVRGHRRPQALSDYSRSTEPDSPQLRSNREDRKISFLLGFVGVSWRAWRPKSPSEPKEQLALGDSDGAVGPSRVQKTDGPFPSRGDSGRLRERRGGVYAGRTLSLVRRAMNLGR